VNEIKLFDLRTLDKGPFGTFRIPGEHLDLMDVLFSDDGKWLLASTTTNQLYLLDAFTGDVVQKLTSFKNDSTCRLGVSFSPDSQYVSTGSEDGTIHTWQVGRVEAEEVAIWEGHAGPVGCVAWNPKYQIVASTCSATAFWIPEKKGTEV